MANNYNRNRYRSKHHAHQSSVKVWTCKNCETQHRRKKPTDCNQCGFNDFYYFASQFEAKRYAELRLQEKIGHIRQLKTQVAYPIKVNSLTVCKYIADFQYTIASTGQQVVEDTKGHEKAVTELFKLKQKLMAAVYGVEVKTVYQNKARARR